MFDVNDFKALGMFVCTCTTKKCPFCCEMNKNSIVSVKLLRDSIVIFTLYFIINRNVPLGHLSAEIAMLLSSILNQCNQCDNFLLAMCKHNLNLLTLNKNSYP